MVLVPWRCYEGLSCFSEEMDQLFDRFFGRELTDRPWERLTSSRLSIRESDDEVCGGTGHAGFLSRGSGELPLRRACFFIKAQEQRIRKSER